MQLSFFFERSSVFYGVRLLTEFGKIWGYHIIQVVEIPIQLTGHLPDFRGVAAAQGTFGCQL